jgi:ABC-type polysaccharide/polyol phosphate transport system ATPase subunit
LKIPINGRVASLLEVGTGFHPELSGRAGRQNYIMDNPEKKR